ncbi:MAG: TldD/PmbA family protein [Clostridiales bacterium]|nr:TldD/PmbA family protein [Clostridiales bacterium]
MNNIRQIAQTGLDKLLSLGADSAVCRAERSELREFTVDAGRFSLLRTTFDNALSMTVIKDHRRGVVSTNDLTDASLTATAQECLAAAEASQPDEAWALATEKQDKSFTLGAPEADLDKLFDRSRELLDSIHREYPKVMVEQMIVSHRRNQSVYLNSNDIAYTTLSGEYEVSLMFSGHDGDKSGSFNGAGVGTDSLDLPFIELGDIRQSLADAENQIYTTATEGKFEGTVIITPQCMVSFLFMLLQNYVADGVILDGTSQWKDRLGEKVADERLTVRLAPLDDTMVCGERYTQEGFLSRDYDVIKNGVLKQFMLSHYVANTTGLKRAPNGAHNLVVEPGDATLEELIKGTKKGLLVSRFSDGQPGANGEFSGVAKNTFLIEDGKIAGAVIETMISGNLAGMLNNIVGITQERVKDGNFLLPWMAVDGITISGK